LVPAHSLAALEDFPPSHVDVVVTGDPAAAQSAGDRWPQATILLMESAENPALWGDKIRAACWQQLLRLTQRALEDKSAQLRGLLERFGFSSPFDPRTGWHSHAHIIDRCQQEVVRAARYSLPIALVLVDVADLRADGLTDQDRDGLLTQLSARVRPICRHCDIVGHYGHDAFLGLLTNTDLQGGKGFSHRVHQTLQAPLLVDDQQIHLDWTIALAARGKGVPATPNELLNSLERQIERIHEKGLRRAVVCD
jgi:diguanylate cyclase (GGDEF)-like protein